MSCEYSDLLKIALHDLENSDPSDTSRDADIDIENIKEPFTCLAEELDTFPCQKSDISKKTTEEFIKLIKFSYNIPSPHFHDITDRTDIDNVVVSRLWIYMMNRILTAGKIHIYMIYAGLGYIKEYQEYSSVIITQIVDKFMKKSDTDCNTKYQSLIEILRDSSKETRDEIITDIINTTIKNAEDQANIECLDGVHCSSRTLYY
jgi:hypothetical protein